MDNIKERIERVAKNLENNLKTCCINDCSEEDCRLLAYNLFSFTQYLVENEMCEKTIMEGNAAYSIVINQVLFFLFLEENRHNMPYTKLQNIEKFLEYVTPKIEEEYLYYRTKEDFYPEWAVQVAEENVAYKIYKIIHEGEKLCV